MSGEPRPGVAVVRRRANAFRERLLHNGRLKLAALLLAAVFWVFVRTDETVVSQRLLQAPLKVEGLAANQVVTGLPERVAVRVSGSSSRVAALNPDGVDVVLDLRGVTGEFEETVRVFPPQGIGVVSINPSEILGTAELSAEKRVPVRAVTLGAGPDDTLTKVRVSPGELTVSGAESQVARVTQALVPVELSGPAERGTPYAADAQGNPVAAIRLETRAVSTALTQRPVLAIRRVPLVLGPVDFSGAEVTAALSQNTLTVVGPSVVLGRLERVTATLSETPALSPGQYTLDVALALPEGVSALSAPQLSVRVRARGPGTGN